MSVRLHRPGIWQVRIYRGYNPATGKRLLDVRHVHGTETDARRVEAEMRAPDHSATPAPLRTPVACVHDAERTVGEVITEAIDDLEVIGRAPKTIHDYRGIAAGIEKDQIANMLIRALRPRNVDVYYGRLLRSGKTPERIRKYHSLLRTSVGWAVRWEWVDRNVVRDATPPTVHAKPVTAPPTAAVASVLAQIDRRDDATRRAGVRLLGMLGCRRGEICALRWSDIDWEGKAARIHGSRDETLTADEVDDLAGLAVAWGLTLEQVGQIHESLLVGLIGLAAADGITTNAELTDVARCGDLLGIPRDVLKRYIDEAPVVSGITADRRSSGSGSTETDDLAGLSVCFTGSSTCAVDGVQLSRDAQRVLAAAHGLTVCKGVTKKLDILVVADPDTESGKARTARRYGTRIMVERAFWHDLGVTVE